ncbi:MAG: MOSC domain-containing protein [Coriobacteriaceae bacterium]|jgi:MOSC domain-containing protein YiiM|nr:MOSC domain-containing protein [Coriobacteriaceae bacterium]
MGTVKAVCTSDIKGIQKTGTDSVTLEEDFGITGDAHAGKWHRQVSLLGYESIEDFKEKGAQVNDGSFGENIIVEGFDLKTLPIGTRFACNEVILELTQIGKECHAHCAIYHEMGDCIMPREGVFTKVVRGGTIAVGDTIDIVG